MVVPFSPGRLHYFLELFPLPGSTRLTGDTVVFPGGFSLRPPNLSLLLCTGVFVFSLTTPVPCFLVPTETFDLFRSFLYERLSPTSHVSGLWNLDEV